jgi:REP element-mobilizing transposase RayT
MRKLSHTQYDLQYHVIWTTKYRYKVLGGKISLRLRELIRQGCRAKNTCESVIFPVKKLSTDVLRSQR